MKPKLAIATVAVMALLAVVAAPSSASAAGWDLDVEAGILPVKIVNITGGEVKFTQLGLLSAVTCQKVEGSGVYNTATEGTLELTFTTCTRGTEVCQTEPALKEAIKTTTLTFHNIMIDSTTQVSGGRPGILITGNNNHFATFACAGVTTEVIGNGIIGELENPTCGTAGFQKTESLSFTSEAAGKQTYKQVETAGTTFDLSARTGATTLTASVNMTPVLELERAMKTTCP